MIKRASIPPMTYLALTDAVTGMIGILLVVLVLARPPQEEVHRLEQADLRASCELLPPPSAGSRPEPRLRLGGEGEQLSLEAVLADARQHGRIGLRLAVERDMDDPRQRSCMDRLRAEVARHNAAYEQNRNSIEYPYVFLTPYQARTQASTP